MACFLTPLVAALIVSITRRLARELGEKLKLDILSTILWGGSALLAVEHAWHGEIVPYPPFLTAMTSPSEFAVAVHEMATVGLTMVVASAGLWGGILGISRSKLISLRAPLRAWAKTLSSR